MRMLDKIKRFIRKIFIDYNEIDKICEQKMLGISNSIYELKRENIELKEVITNIQGNTNELNKNMYTLIESNNLHQIQVNQQNEEIIKATNQFLYNNTELLNIKNDQEQKNILIVGFYGAPNLGDELMLETLLDYMKDIKNKKITILLADNPEYNIDKYEDVRFLHYPKTLYDFNILAEKYDYIIFGGGAIIDDGQYENQEAYKYDLGTILIKLSLRAIAFNKKVICLALSASTQITNVEYIQKLRYVIDNSYYFSVRDSFSKKMLTEVLGQDYDKNIIQINDIVLSNKKIAENIETTEKKERINNIGIVWIANDNNIDKLQEMLDEIEQNWGKSCNINLIPFYEYRNIDTSFYSNILKKQYNNCIITIEKIPQNMEETIGIFKKNDIIIGMRYHSILIAHALNIPCISICYDIHSHYPNKIKYINQLFNKKEELSYKQFNSKDIIKEMYEISKIDYKYEPIREIEIYSQKQINDVINGIDK